MTNLDELRAMYEKLRYQKAPPYLTEGDLDVMTLEFHEHSVEAMGPHIIQLRRWLIAARAEAESLRTDAALGRLVRRMPQGMAIQRTSQNWLVWPDIVASAQQILTKDLIGALNEALGQQDEAE